MTRQALFIAVALVALAAVPVVAEEPKPAPAASEVKADALKPNLSGFVQVDYRAGDGANRPAAVEHELALRRARLTLSGKASDRITYGMTVQLETSTAALLDAFVDYSLNPLVKVRAGQYKYDFDLAGRESATAFALIDRAFVTNAVAGSLNGASTASSPAASFRDRGVTVCGDTTKNSVNWGYSLGLFQGAGRNGDNNDGFSYVANVRVYPVKPLRLNAGYLSSDATPKGDARRNRYDAWTAGLSYEHKVGSVTAEYYSGSRDKSVREESVNGFYVSATYSPLPKVDVTGRYQHIEDDRFTSGNESAGSADVGVRWYFVRKGARSGTHLSLNYMARSAGRGFAEGLTVLNDGRGAALTDGNLVKDVVAVRFQVQF